MFKLVKSSVVWLFVVVVLFWGGCAGYKDSSQQEGKAFTDEDYEMTNSF